MAAIAEFRDMMLSLDVGIQDSEDEAGNEVALVNEVRACFPDGIENERDVILSDKLAAIGIDVREILARP